VRNGTSLVASEIGEARSIIVSGRLCVECQTVGLRRLQGSKSCQENPDAIIRRSLLWAMRRELLTGATACGQGQAAATAQPPSRCGVRVGVQAPPAPARFNCKG
jgi:hypothetical protein